MRVRSLALHARYRCASSGACCTSGFPIAVEPAAERAIREGVGTGALRGWDGSPYAGWSRPLAEAPPGEPPDAERARVALRVRATGACVFFDAGATRLCAVHARLGEQALPTACRQFPRVVTLTPLGASVSLSHYCPTAAGLLLAEPGEASPGGPTHGVEPHHEVEASGENVAENPPGAGRQRAVPSGDPLLRIVEAPAAFPSDWPFAGLDARAALPPFLRPGVLMSWPALERWEQHAALVLAKDGLPEAAVGRLAEDAERARAWTPAAGEFDAFFAAALSAGGSPPSAWGPGDAPQRGELAALPDGAASWRLVADCVPEPTRLAARPPHDGAGLVAAGWPALCAPVRRWLAAKAFGSWVALQGQGLRTTVAALEVSLGVLRAECARGCVSLSRPLDAGILLAAVRRADLLLVHLVDPERFARRLSGRESEPAIVN